MAQGVNQCREHFPVEQRTFMLQLNVAEQAIHTFDRMLDVSSAQIGQRQTAPVQESADAAHQGAQALAVQSGECLGKCLV